MQYIDDAILVFGPGLLNLRTCNKCVISAVKSERHLIATQDVGIRFSRSQNVRAGCSIAIKYKSTSIYKYVRSITLSRCVQRRDDDDVLT